MKTHNHITRTAIFLVVAWLLFNSFAVSQAFGADPRPPRGVQPA